MTRCDAAEKMEGEDRSTKSKGRKRNGKMERFEKRNICGRRKTKTRVEKKGGKPLSQVPSRFFFSLRFVLVKRGLLPSGDRCGR